VRSRFVVIKSLATGVLAVVAAAIARPMTLHLYAWYSETKARAIRGVPPGMGRGLLLGCAQNVISSL